jgi:hypothetical protein
MTYTSDGLFVSITGVPANLNMCAVLFAPQVTYTGDGLFVSVGLVCSSKSNSHAALADNFRSAVYAYSKTAVYATTTAGSTATINGAVYIVAKSWYRSVHWGQCTLVCLTLHIVW